MPEGDTIHRLAERINARLAGMRCTRCVTRDPRLVGVDLAGEVLTEAVAVGKHLLVRFDSGRTMHIHLGMDGSVLVGRAAAVAEWRRRIELWFDQVRMTGVDLPVVGVVATADEERLVGYLGPDVNDTVVDVAAVARRIAAGDDVALAAALLDQRRVAGFGNVFAVELPFIGGISPHQPISSVSGLESLVGLGVALIHHSTAVGWRNTTGRRLHTADHWVYGRVGRSCQVCDTTILGAATTPWGRLTAWCPTCQPAVAARAVDGERIRRLLALHPARRDRHLSAAAEPGRPG